MKMGCNSDCNAAMWGCNGDVDCNARGISDEDDVMVGMG